MLSINIGLCSIFVCPDKGVAASAVDFNVGSNTLVPPVAHQYCVDTGRDSALEVDWEKETSHAAPGARTHVSLAPDFSHQELEPTSVLRLFSQTLN